MCKADATEICGLLTDTLANGNLGEADPQRTSIPNAISQICICLKDDFKPFLAALVPALLSDAQRSIDFKITDVDDGDVAAAEEGGEKGGNQQINMKVKGFEGTKQVSMNTNALEVKINAVQTLKSLARNLGTSFYEYVEPVAAVCLGELILDPYAHTLRKEAAKTMRFCIAACHDHPERQKALFILTYAQLMQDVEKRKVKAEFDQVNQLLKEVFKQLRLFTHFKALNMTVFTQEDA